MNSKNISKRSFIAASTASLCGLLSRPAFGETEPKTKPCRVGVYDSRAIAVAYLNSPGAQKVLAGVKADYEKAKSAGDQTRMKEIEKRMQSKQRRAHEQGFSTGSVIEFLETIQKNLPTIAKEQGVELIVSKWEVLFQSPLVDPVDITDALVKAFNPSEQGLKWIRSLGSQRPVPVDELRDD